MTVPAMAAPSADVDRSADPAGWFEWATAELVRLTARLDQLRHDVAAAEPGT